ncbi:hypothetical protein [Brasilonema sp. UFV-L1]|uniref:hypothetical protein n=1 Tax=Brasilonema sp. UFV-L1 TaxID=2234130 RepID=UPI00145F1DB6|nr:hypothetical protein [Brasilonema sp. UFV-L1]NMG11035.1 hypothetical protein [Brasilonema sp. UFV-L1]
MLKHLMLSGWLRVQPFFKYCIFAMLIAPLMASSEHTTSAQQTQVAKVPSVTIESESVAVDSVLKATATVDEANLISLSKAAPTNSLTEKSHSIPMSLGAISQPQIQIDEQTNNIESSTVQDNSAPVQMPNHEPLTGVEIAPPTQESESVSNEIVANQQDLVQRLKASKVLALAMNNSSASGEVLTAKTLEAVKNESLKKGQQKLTAVTVVEQPAQDAQGVQQDPVGSPHPIPWAWIQATQDAIGSKGISGVRYYRSMPVISPDGRYAMYSRVQLQVEPQMHNSRVTSVLFVEDKQTKKLRVISSTAPINDPLLKVQQVSLPSDTQGTIAVLVPVSWSQKGDRFLARKFEGAMNTSDVTDYAVIWDREQNRSENVTPSQEELKHEIAVLLGWSQTHPDQVLFRAGELGEEEWPLVTVAYDGKTVGATGNDQPVIYGQRIKNVWATPQVAYR